jgi:hypothetical protein
MVVQGPAATFICDVVVRGGTYVSTDYHSIHHRGYNCFA